MFDDTFKKWVNTNELDTEDAVVILEEWSKMFHSNPVPASTIVLMLQHPMIQFVDLPNSLAYALKILGIKKGYQWSEVLDQYGNKLTSFFNN